MLAGLFSYPKRHFYLSENNRHYFHHITKIWGKENSSFSSYFNPKIVGDNRSSEQTLTETVCWVPLSTTASHTNAVFTMRALSAFHLYPPCVLHSIACGRFRERCDKSVTTGTYTSWISQSLDYMQALFFPGIVSRARNENREAGEFLA